MEEKKHCKWYNDEFCTNDKSPCVADYCPVVEYPELCMFREEDLVKDDTEIDVGMIINALEYCFDDSKSDCVGCLFRVNNECTYDQKHGMSIVLNLIRRLQGENAGLQKQIETQRKIIEYQDSVEERNAELQKQVDERENEIDRLEKVVHEQAEQYYDCEQRTAKEILQAVDNESCGQTECITNRIRRLYGVEVKR
jgi:hypothetical protein